MGEDSSDTFDILSYSLFKFSHLETLTLPWQPNITSLKECLKVENFCKMQHLTLIYIPAIIPPIDVALFIDKHMAEDGYMCLSFLIPTTLIYYETIVSLISSKKFHFYIKLEPNQNFILHS